MKFMIGLKNGDRNLLDCICQNKAQIYEVYFSWGDFPNGRANQLQSSQYAPWELQDMQQQVQAIFTSAELYVKQTTTVMDTHSRLYSFLMGRNNYTLETSVTPSYSLLCHGIGDSRAFANVYAAMCTDAGLECHVISGIRDGEPWCWNLIRFRGGYYHVDLLRCHEDNRFAFKSAEEMSGYVWDYAAYP